MSESFLLDTQIGLRIFIGDADTISKLKKLAEDKDNRFVFHQVSTWEIQIKYSIGKLPLPSPPEQLIPKAIVESGFCYEKISDEAIFLLGKLPLIHRDPFDRLLVAHAITSGATLITTDQTLEKYPVKSLIIG